jgi:hypothetical protein
MDFATLHHLEMEIKNVNGEIIPLHFYTDSRGSKLVPTQV